MEIVNRQGWGSRYGLGTLDPGPENNVVIHHSYQPTLNKNTTPTQEMAAIRGIEKYHVEHNKWDGIGYNWLVAPSGRKYEGRGWRYRGAHAGPINADSIGICLLIDGSTTDPNPELIQGTRELIQLGISLGEIAPSYKISGHKDWMKDRTCPGEKVYNRLPEFRHDYGAQAHVAVGTRVWSPNYGENLIVTRYISDTNWEFVPESALLQLRSIRAGTPLSRMPKPR